MKIKNISPSRLSLGFINQGVSLIPNQEYIVPDNVVENTTFKKLQNMGIISIVEYDSDFTRYAIKDELSSDPVAEVNLLTETLIVLSPTTVSSTTHTPIPESLVFKVNGIAYTSIVISGNNITWNSLEFNLDVSDEVTVTYSYEV